MDDWVKQVNEAITRTKRYPLNNGHIMIVQWQSDMSESMLSKVKVLLDDAYSNRSMWPYFQRNGVHKNKRLVFTLIDKNEEILATRSIGETIAEDNYWDIECAQAVHQDPPVAGGSLTVKRSHRGRGLGNALLEESTDWIKQHSDLKAIFGDTVSCMALEIYRRKGAFININCIERLCRQYDCQSLFDFFANNQSLEQLPPELGVNYVWCLDSRVVGILDEFGYQQL